MDSEEPLNKKPRLSKNAATKVKNKMAGEVQITTEQLIREAPKDRQPPDQPKQPIAHEEELKDLQSRKRQQFEDSILKNKNLPRNWIKYAQWEESQKEFSRARSVYERALTIDHQSIVIWLKYAEMEMRHKQVNHARNVWNRAVTVLPRVNQFWYKYAYMEEILGNVGGAREVFERWIQWEPEEQAWLSFIKMEIKYAETNRARKIYEKLVTIHPNVNNWIHYAKFEEAHGYISNTRDVYSRCAEFYRDKKVDEKLFIAFAKFEEDHKEYERARAIYKYALDHLHKDQTETVELLKCYTRHEKKYGNRAGIEDVVLNKRKFQYEEELKANPTNYDVWFDYIRMMEENGIKETTREAYEQAITNVPPSQEKRFWRRYIYLWINYAIYEEMVAKDITCSRAVYKACIELVPHKLFTFAKIWIMFAKFEIRQRDLTAARKVLGVALGKCPKPKLFKTHIKLELQLREFDRCRKLYKKFLEYDPENCAIWIKFAELEGILGDTERARAIYELAVSQSSLEMPEIVWKAYIDFEVKEQEFSKARNLYKRYKHTKDNTQRAMLLEVDDDVNAPNLKLLQMAKNWKEAMDDKHDSDANEDESDSDDSN